VGQLAKLWLLDLELPGARMNSDIMEIKLST